MAIDLYEGLEKAQVFDRGNPIKPGTADLEVVRFIEKDTVKNGPMLIVEFRVIDSGTSPHHAGDKVSWYQKLQDKRVSLPNIKKLLVALLGYDYSSQREEIESSVNPRLKTVLNAAINDQKLTGAKVRSVAFLQKGDDGNDYTRSAWEPYRTATS